jgi:hypothetical protein
MARKHTGQELDDPIDSILLLLLPGSGCLHFLPQQFIVAFKFALFSRDGGLVTLYRIDGMYVQDLRIRGWQGRRLPLIGLILRSWDRIFVALDVAEEIWLGSAKVWMGKVRVF